MPKLPFTRLLVSPPLSWPRRTTLWPPRLGQRAGAARRSSPRGPLWGARTPGSREEPQQPVEVSLEREAVHYPVHHPVVALELCRLEALRQPLARRLLYDPGPGEPDPRPRLGDDHVRGGGERGGHPAEGGVCQDRDVEQRAVHV